MKWLDLQVLNLKSMRQRDIYTADHQVDADGQRTLYFAKDALVATVATDADGYATVKNLPLGRYYVKEKNAPDTYVLNTVPENVEFAYADQGYRSDRERNLCLR